MSSRIFGGFLSVLLILVSCADEKKEIKPPKPENTLETLKKAVKTYPDSTILVHTLIEQYRNEGHYDSAQALTDELIISDSGNAYLWSIKATLYFENEDTLQAIDAMEHAVEIYPLPEYLAALGSIYAKIKSRNALIIADELLLLNKSKYSKNAFFIKGMYYNFSNKPDSALLFLDKSLELDFSYMYVYREKAIALYQLKRYQEALAVLERAVTIQNNFDEGYFWMGKVYEKLNQREDALQSYKNALLYDKDFVEARQALEKLQRQVP